MTPPTSPTMRDHARPLTHRLAHTVQRSLVAFAVLLLPCILLSGLLPAMAHAATYYLAPDGKDGGAGTSANPWKTFGHAVSKLQPGDTLLVKPGTYTRASSGHLNVDCGGKARNGTPTNPITVKAEQEREAFLKSDGEIPPIQMRHCAYWTLEGLRAEGGDFRNERNDDGGSVVLLLDSHHLTIRRLLLRLTNRYCNAAALFANTDHSLFEENELYSYHRHGLQLKGAQHNTVRRNYANSRGHKDLAGGYRSANKQDARGDSGFIIYGGAKNTANRFENNISEGNASAYGLQARYSLTEQTHFLGNISLRDTWGMKTQAGPSSGQVSANTTVENHVVIDSEGIGLGLGSTKGLTCKQCTVIGAGVQGVLAYKTPGAAGGGYAFTGENLLVLNAASTGVSIAAEDMATWRIDGVNAYGNRTNYDPARSSNYRNQQSVDPKLGACKVWIPDDSPMKHAGTGGADIGANILYRYEGGSLTTQPLWDPATGRFPCGAVIAGVNDVPGASCSTVHQRLNVNTNGCAFPSGYTQGAPSFAEQPFPTNLRILTGGK